MYIDQFKLHLLHVSEFDGLGMLQLNHVYQHYGFFLQTLTVVENVVQNENFDSLLYIKEQVTEVILSETKYWDDRKTQKHNTKTTSPLHMVVGYSFDRSVLLERSWWEDNWYKQNLVVRHECGAKTVPGQREAAGLGVRGWRSLVVVSAVVGSFDVNSANSLDSFSLLILV